MIRYFLGPHVCGIVECTQMMTTSYLEEGTDRPHSQLIRSTGKQGLLILGSIICDIFVLLKVRGPTGELEKTTNQRFCIHIWKLVGTGDNLYAHPDLRHRSYFFRKG